MIYLSTFGWTSIFFQVGDVMTPQMQIDHVKSKINDVENETNVIKRYCIQNQSKNVKLLDEKNKQTIEINMMRKCKYLITK